MPKHVEFNVRDQAYAALVARMNTISVANGYNTSPVVTGRDDSVPDRTSPPIVYVLPGPDAIPLTSVSMIATVDSTFYVTGAVYVEPEADDGLVYSPLNALIQDVRTAISSGWQEMNSSITLATGGNPVDVMWLLGGMSTDEGALRANGEAQFTQVLVARYLNGPEW